jgi:OOP family OmpA-OmpF porin
MNTKHTLRLLVLAGLGPVLATPALAQDHSYFYGGLSAGMSRTKIDEDRITASLLGAGLVTNSFVRDERGQAYRIFGGYQFNRYWGVEAGYFDLGKFGFNATTVPAGSLSGQIRLQGLNLDLVATMPLSDRLSLLGRVGAQTARATDRFAGTGAVSVLNPNPGQRENNYKVGVGLQYEFSPSFLMRGEIERLRVNDAVGNNGDVNVFSLSVVFPFGRTPASAPRLAAAPVYVAPPPPAAPLAPVVVQAPVVVAVPPTPVPVVVPPRRRVSFSAESLFGFDKSTIKSEGRIALDLFAKETQGTRFDVITVEGHTDRLGTAAYNERLSMERAEAVKSYLVQTGGLDAGKVTAVGKGETSPATQAQDCVGNKPSPKLIACLQPDRRVEIEVTGTRAD